MTLVFLVPALVVTIRSSVTIHDKFKHMDSLNIYQPILPGIFAKHIMFLFSF